MHPRLAELAGYLETETERLHRLYESIPGERRGERPAPNRWSPAEIVHHLAIVERRVASRIASLAEQARALPPESDASSIVTSSLASSVIPRAVDRTTRFVSSEASQPRGTDPSRVWEMLTDARRELNASIAAADGLPLGRVSAPHPALGSLDGYDWIAFAGAHIARHADQLREGT